MKVQRQDLVRLEELLTRTEIPMNYDRGRVFNGTHGSKTPAGKGRSVLFGENPFKKNNTLTRFTEAHPEIYQELLQLASKYVPFPVNKFMLNKNYQTQPHYDPMNSSRSVIFSFGDYQGGELVVEGNVVDTFLTLVEMDGRTQLHWNNPITGGTKYSIVFFS